MSGHASRSYHPSAPRHEGRFQERCRQGNEIWRCGQARRMAEIICGTVNAS